MKNTFSTKKNNLKSPKFQAFKEKNFSPAPEVKKNPVLTLSRLTKTQKRVFDYLICRSNMHRNTYVSQHTIAGYLEVRRETVNRAIRKLKNLGLVITYQRWDNSNFTRISPYFNDIGIRHRLSKIFQSFKFISLIAMMIYAQVNYNHEVTLEYSSSLLKTNLPTNTNFLPTTNLSFLTKNGRLKLVKVSDEVKKIKKRKAMKNEPFEPTPGLRLIADKMGLTQEGMVSLGCFDDVVLGSAFKEYQAAKGVRHPFRYFFAICKRTAQELGVAIDWQRYYNLREQYRITDTTLLVKEEKNTNNRNSDEATAGAPASGAAPSGSVDSQAPPPRTPKLSRKNVGYQKEERVSAYKIASGVKDFLNDKGLSLLGWSMVRANLYNWLMHTSYISETENDQVAERFIKQSRAYIEQHGIDAFMEKQLLKYRSQSTQANDYNGDGVTTQDCDKLSGESKFDGNVDELKQGDE